MWIGPNGRAKWTGVEWQARAFMIACFDGDPRPVRVLLTHQAPLSVSQCARLSRWLAEGDQGFRAACDSARFRQQTLSARTSFPHACLRLPAAQWDGSITAHKNLGAAPHLETIEVRFPDDWFARRLGAMFHPTSHFGRQRTRRAPGRCSIVPRSRSPGPRAAPPFRAHNKKPFLFL